MGYFIYLFTGINFYLWEILHIPISHPNPAVFANLIRYNYRTYRYINIKKTLGQMKASGYINMFYKLPVVISIIFPCSSPP